MTDLITEARELCEKAGPAPWRKTVANTLVDGKGKAIFFEPEGTPNAAFIARSRTLIPELCDALEAANAHVAALNRAIQDGRAFLLEHRPLPEGYEESPLAASMRKERESMTPEKAHKLIMGTGMYNEDGTLKEEFVTEEGESE